jgi:tyrosinase
MKLLQLLLPSILLALVTQALVTPRDQDKSQTQSKYPKCTNPKVRKEWRKWTKAEKTDYFNAVKCLTSLPHDPSYKPTLKPKKDYPKFSTTGSYYDDLVYWHLGIRDIVPFTVFSLPYHRWYEWVYETALKEKCGYQGTLGYWDYTQDASDFEHNTFLSPDTFGTWGDASNDYEVQDGVLSSLEYAYPSPHKVRRKYTPNAPDGSLYNNTLGKEAVSRLLKDFEGDFKGFQHYIENGPHVAAHYIMGGDLAGSCNQDAITSTGCKDDPFAPWSANDPTFWFQHVMVDRIWTAWQNQANNFWLFEGGATINPLYPNGGPPFQDISDTVIQGGGFVPDLPVKDLLDTTGGYLCYVYE